MTEEEVSVKSSITWCLPHHPVFHSPKSGKVRVVFDATSKFIEESLNKNLHAGPDLLSSLVGTFRFRNYKVALVTNMETMFHW